MLLPTIYLSDIEWGPPETKMMGRPWVAVEPILFSDQTAPPAMINYRSAFASKGASTVIPNFLRNADFLGQLTQH